MLGCAPIMTSAQLERTFAWWTNRIAIGSERVKHHPSIDGTRGT
jgi:pterin-4a-carbinolamine dehydratase